MRVSSAMVRGAQASPTMQQVATMSVSRTDLDFCTTAGRVTPSPATGFDMVALRSRKAIPGHGSIPGQSTELPTIDSCFGDEHRSSRSPLPRLSRERSQPLLQMRGKMLPLINLTLVRARRELGWQLKSSRVTLSQGGITFF